MPDASRGMVQCLAQVLDACVLPEGARISWRMQRQDICFRVHVYGGSVRTERMSIPAAAALLWARDPLPDVELVAAWLSQLAWRFARETHTLAAPHLKRAELHIRTTP